MWIQTIAPHMCIVNSAHISEIGIRYKGIGKYAVVAVVAGSDHIIEIAPTEKDAITTVEHYWGELHST